MDFVYHNLIPSLPLNTKVWPRLTPFNAVDLIFTQSVQSVNVIWLRVTVGNINHTMSTLPHPPMSFAFE